MHSSGCTGFLARTPPSPADVLGPAVLAIALTSLLRMLSIELILNGFEESYQCLSGRMEISMSWNEDQSPESSWSFHCPLPRKDITISCSYIAGQDEKPCY